MAMDSKLLAAVNDEARWNASEALAGVGTFGLEHISGTWTVVFEARVRGSADTAWVQVQAANLNTGALAVTTTNAITVSLWRLDLSGQLEVRVRVTASTGSVRIYPGVSLG